MSIIVREYNDEDVVHLSSLMNKFQDYLVALDPLKRLRRMPEYGEKKISEMLEKVRNEHGVVFLAVEGVEQVVGFIAGTIERPSDVDLLERVPTIYGHVIELFVSESERGQGVGKELMIKMEEYFKKHGCTEIAIEVFEPNQSAYEFYKKLNYMDRSRELIKIIE